MLSRTPKQNEISFFTVAVWAVCIVLTLGSIPQGIGVHAQSNNVKTSTSTANILLLNKYNSHAQAKVNLLRAVVTHATKKENEWTLFYEEGGSYKTCTLSSSATTATPISPENKCVQFTKKYDSTERIAELKVIRKKKNQTEYVNTTFKFTTRGTEKTVVKTPTAQVANVSQKSNLAKVNYVDIRNDKNIPIKKPKEKIIFSIAQPNPQYSSSQNYRLIAKCDTLRIWIRPSSLIPKDKDLENFCWNYYISNKNEATPNPISKLDKTTLYDVVFADIIYYNEDTRGVYKRENQTVWIHCEEKENCIDTPNKRAEVQYILFHEVHHLRQHILLCGKNSEKCFRSFYDEYQGLLEGGARYEEYRRETRLTSNAGIPEASKNESCITKWTQDDYDCAGFVIAKLHQLYEVNKKPGKLSVPYMDIFILKKMQKTGEKSLEKAITRIFQEDTNLKYDVKLSVIEKKVAKAMNVIIKNEENKTKKAEKICAHPDLPNYYPYLSYCPTKK